MGFFVCINMLHSIYIHAWITNTPVCFERSTFPFPPSKATIVTVHHHTCNEIIQARQAGPAGNFLPGGTCAALT
jgi:hypothetical protein